MYIIFNKMKSIALIEKNRCNFDDIEKYALPLLYRNLSVIESRKIKADLNEYLWNQLTPYIKFIDIDEKDSIETIVNLINSIFPDRKPNDFYYHTEGSYSFPKKFIELIYSQPLWKEYQDSQISNINNIGCLFSLSHHVVENNCILLANSYDFNAPNFVTLTNIGKEDITRVIRRRFFFTAILLKDGQFIKYYYQNIDFLIREIFKVNSDEMDILSFTIFKYNLKYYFKKDASYKNKIATRIYGNKIIYGDVLIIHEMEDNIYANISVHELRRISVLAYGSISNRQLKAEENYELPITEYDDNGKEYKKNITPLWSRYLVIEKRMNQWKTDKNKCCQCNKDIIDLVLCNICYRLKYCSKNCKELHYPVHKDDCIDN